MPPMAVLLGCALVFDFLNGFHDSSNIVATVIFSRALSPRKALLLAAVAECSGPFLFGVAVANTVGSKVVRPGAVTIAAVLAAIISAIIWDLLTWLLGLPSSSSHALIGGILGAVLLDFGPDVIRYDGLLKVLVALFISPLLGLVVSYLLMKVILFLGQWFSP
ncbi:MAG: inorganic phosphate transporter, partial [Chloroflexota bacterium]|nr:inorganic phosphate transporter [Chloroflexota bacterium]